MKCSSLSFYRKPCKNKDIGENGLCKRHAILEVNAEPTKEGKCKYIRRNNKRCNQCAYDTGEDKDYCSEHSLYVLSNSRNGGCKCCVDLYINIQQEQLENSCGI